MTTIDLDPKLFLPEPDPRAVRYTIISVDDHLVEPPRHVRGPAAGPAAGPRAADRRDRAGSRGLGVRRAAATPRSGMNAVAGRRPEDRQGRAVPLRADAPGLLRHRRPHPRHGHQRGVGVAELPVDDHRLLRARCSRRRKDPELGLAVTRAWNDWFFEEWYSPYPERIDPAGHHLPGRRRASAPRRSGATPRAGFPSVTLPERPHRIGLPSIFTGYWDPIIAACAETDTVICLHVGSSGMADYPDGAPDAAARRHAVRAAVADGVRGVAVVGVRGPLPEPQDRHERGRHRLGGDAHRPARQHRRPLGLRARSFAGPAPGRRAAAQLLVLHDRRPVDHRHARRIGVDHIMVEIDYPHGDGTWPDTQAVIEKYWGHLPVEELRQLTHRNAAKLYRHPLPEVCLP